MAAKKSLYEILDVSPAASSNTIAAAHQRQLKALQAEQATLGRDEFGYRRTLLKLALETLSDPLARKTYDEKLAAEPPAASRSDKAAPMGVVAAPGILSRRAEALSLRADALSLRADAISIETDASQLDTAPTVRSEVFRVLRTLGSSTRTAVTVIGTIVVLSILAQFSAMLFGARSKAAEETAAAAAARAEDKLVIQEYYQTYGVRPASAAEARLLMEEHDRQEREQRATDREQQRIEAEARRFKEESRRVGDQVSADLRNAQERLRMEELHKKAQQEEEERRRVEAEEARLAKERAKWQRVLAE